MKDYCQYVDVFQGVDEIDLPEPQGVAAAWRLIKGRCGNNTPAAALPFGRLTAGCYSGGYSSGYGRIMYNTHGEVPKLYGRNKFKGMSHIQNDGTGDIDTFYNYAVLSPFIVGVNPSLRVIWGARHHCDLMAALDHLFAYIVDTEGFWIVILANNEYFH